MINSGQQKFQHMDHAKSKEKTPKTGKPASGPEPVLESARLKFDNEAEAVPCTATRSPADALTKTPTEQLL